MKAHLLHAYRSYLSHIYSMPEDQADLWNVDEVPAWFIEQRQRAELVPAFVERVKAAFEEAERRWPRRTR